jgi:hypothetical protein
MKKISFLILFLICLNSFGQNNQNKTYKLQNALYSLELDLNVIRISHAKESRSLSPVVQVIQSQNNPLMLERKSDNNLSPQVAWNNPMDLKKVPEQDKSRPSAAYYKNTGNETNFYKAGKSATLTATSIDQPTSRKIRYSFPKSNSYTIILEITLPEGNEAPLIETEITTHQKAWYSVGFTGIASQDTSAIDFLYQPMIWTWKRFPEKPYLTSEKFATTAATFVNNGKFTEGISPDPSEIPYRFVNGTNSRFGFLLRTAEGKARPTLFAPILGGAGSLMNRGQSFRFKTRYILKSGDWYEGMAYILKDIFHYKNERKNAAVTLNQTLDNIIEIAMNDKSGGWIDSLKGFDYVQDAVGTVKVVSALHQLGVAMVTGNDDIYSKRALPTIAYVMSREKYLYSTDERQKTQNPSHFLKGPCVEIGELSGLYQLTNGQTFAFQAEINRLFGITRKLNLNTETGGGTWQDYLYRYRVSKNKADLDKAIKGANEYIKFWQPYPSVFTNDPGLVDKSSAFLTDFSPKLYDLLEIYEETKDKKYLDMALSAARQMVLWTRSNPMAPDSTIIVNKGGQVKGVIGKRYKINSSESLPGYDNTTEIPEQEIAAWQTSLVGLPPEQPYTYRLGPIMLTHHPAWFLKLAHLANDTLLKTAAYNAILGRYAGFPGYYYTSLHTNVYQSADYAAHDYWDIKYNAIFHNHIFPHITLLIDFLVNDAFYRSSGKVDFPGIYAPGYAYLTSKVYGSKLGSIFGNHNIRLWLPADAIQSNTTAFNHLMGISENDFYVVLMNTFNEKVSTEVRLNPDVIHWIPKKVYNVTVYYPDGSTQKTTFQNGMLNTDIIPQGMAAYKIEGLKIEVPLFNKMDAEKTKSGPQSFVRDETSTGLGTLTGMLINTFPQFSDAYIFTDKTEKDFKQVTIEYRIGNEKWTTKKDNFYPYEFDIHLKNPKDKLEFKLIALDMDNKTITSNLYKLSNED